MTERDPSLKPLYAKPKQVAKLTREGIANPSEVLREDAIVLTSNLGREEIRRTRIKAREISRETGLIPELTSAPIAEVARKVIAAQKLGSFKEAEEAVNKAREELYTQMVEAAARAEGSSLPSLSEKEEVRLSRRAETALERNARLLGETATSGLAGHKTLVNRGFDVHPQGGEELPPQRSFPEK